MRGLVAKLAERDFKPVVLEGGIVGGTLYGLTNEDVARVKTDMGRPGYEVTEKDAYVLYCATEAATAHHTADTHLPLDQAAFPTLERITGKLLQIRGFDNREVDRLLQS